MIQYPIANRYIKVNFYNGYGGVKTELSNKFLLQVSVHELHIYMLKIYATGFSEEYYDKRLFCIIDSDI